MSAIITSVKIENMSFLMEMYEYSFKVKLTKPLTMKTINQTPTYGKFKFDLVWWYELNVARGKY